jgi:hypothetical protein
MVDRLVPDLQPQPSLDQLAELAVLSRIMRIDAEQELLSQNAYLPRQRIGSGGS